MNSELVSSVMSKAHSISPIGSGSKPDESKNNYATFRCPNCGSMSPVTSCQMLAPNETHIEKCSECSKPIQMQYNSDGEWQIDIATQM